ncbi:MAG: hypothetical protein MO846_12530, partial [Candidatus Devosia symbiotica]|nr:hypothetical protein [Candidatus Devosia symbiotica]
NMRRCSRCCCRLWRAGSLPIPLGGISNYFCVSSLRQIGDRIAFDFCDGAVELGEDKFLVVPKGTEHRPRSLTHELGIILNTGNAASDLTVTELNRL